MKIQQPRIGAVLFCSFQIRAVVCYPRQYNIHIV